ncbi:MAG: wax ester/triacylglycerol synthase domain-containing protein [Spongiibacteraceae bacterium]
MTDVSSRRLMEQRLSTLKHWGGEKYLTPSESLMWRMESIPQGRSSGVSLHFLEGCPDWGRLQNWLQWLCRNTPRLRQRVSASGFSSQPLLWSDDPCFDIRLHMQRVSLPRPGGVSELLKFLEVFSSASCDSDRPPWEVVLIEGLNGRDSVFALKIHHSMTDGGGLIQLFNTALSRVSDEILSAGVLPPAVPVKRDFMVGLGSVARQIKAGQNFLGRATGVVRRGTGHSLVGINDYLRSLQRILVSIGPGSSLLRRRSLATRYQLVNFSVAEFKAIAKAAGGSFNDVYLALVAGAFQRYHAKFGKSCESIPIAFPVSVRKEGDPEGGNRFAAINYALPLDIDDFSERIAVINAFVANARDEPALEFFNHLMPALNTLPTEVLVKAILPVTARMDAQISNIAGLREASYLAGRKVLSHYVLPPRPGCGCMFAMITHEDVAGIAINCDPAAIIEPELLVGALKKEFEAMRVEFLMGGRDG